MVYGIILKNIKLIFNKLKNIMEETKLKGRLYIKEIEDGTIPLPKRANDFLQIYFTRNNNTSPNSTSLSTYSDKLCNNHHCSANRMRSFDDLYMIMKNYYPKTTIKGLFKRLLLFRPLVKNIEKAHYIMENGKSVLKREKKDIYLKPLFTNCGGMRRIRLTYGDYTKHTAYTTMINTDKYDSVYSWKDLLLKLNIKSASELDNYIEENLVIGKEELIKA